MSIVQKAAKALFKDIQIEIAPLGKISEEPPKHERVKKHKKIKNPSFEKAKRLDANGKWEEAANHYYTIFTSTRNPKDKAEAFILLGQIYINLFKYPLADRFFRYVPSQADALFGLALCDWLENRKNEALESAKKAIDLNPNLLKRGYI